MLGDACKMFELVLGQQSHVRTVNLSCSRRWLCRRRRKHCLRPSCCSSSPMMTNVIVNQCCAEASQAHAVLAGHPALKRYACLPSVVIWTPAGTAQWYSDSHLLTGCQTFIWPTPLKKTNEQNKPDTHTHKHTAEGPERRLLNFQDENEKMVIFRKRLSFAVKSGGQTDIHQY